MLTPEDFSPEKFRIHWSVILVIFAAQLIALIALSVAVANHSSFMTASSAATTITATSAAFAPRARMAVNAS